MKISYNWLKEFVDFTQSPREIAKILTFQGFETVVSGKTGNWDKIITAKVLDVEKHPNADKLSLCSVTDGARNYSVVCGAPNVAKGQAVAFAVLGAEVSGFKIESRKIRGIESEGMICSEKELGLKEESNGIMVLPEDTEPGKPLQSVLGESDTVFELEITTNRPDCLNHLGVAREIAAHLKKSVKLPEVKQRNLNDKIKISIKNSELCHRYIGHKITGVKIGTSPDWLKNRIEKCGIRPINNVVDITNYVLFELGHPLHVFDISLLEGEEIIVRNASNDEKILALDGKEYKLDDSMLVIADAKKPQAIAGIIGGEHSGVTEKTKDIILESAVFLSTSVRKTSKKLNLSTDSSYRFERKCSWEMAEMACRRAADLIEQIAGGKVESFKDEIKKPFTQTVIELRPERVNKLLGTDISKDIMIEILNSLDLTATGKGGNLSVNIPSWRLDISQEADLTEEIARIYGYDKIPESVLSVVPDINEGNKYETCEDILRSRLVSLGFCEAINNSFASEMYLKEFDMASSEQILNPISKENEVLRPNLLPGLIANFKFNLAQGVSAVKLFETGTVFTNEGEKRILAILACGETWPEWWKFEDNHIKLPQLDVYYAAGVLNNIFSGQDITLSNVNLNNCAAYFHPGKWSEVKIKNQSIGQYGVIHPKFSSDYANEVIYAEIYLDRVQWVHNASHYRPLKHFPSVKRDLSLVADANITYANIEELIASLRNKSSQFGEMFEEVKMFSKFNLSGGKTSYALHFTFQHKDHTLTEPEINSALGLILDTLKNKLNITLRTS